MVVLHARLQALTHVDESVACAVAGGDDAQATADGLAPIAGRRIQPVKQRGAAVIRCSIDVDRPVAD